MIGMLFFVGNPTVSINMKANMDPEKGTLLKEQSCPLRTSRFQAPVFSRVDNRFSVVDPLPLP